MIGALVIFSGLINFNTGELCRDVMNKINILILLNGMLSFSENHVANLCVVAGRRPSTVGEAETLIEIKIQNAIIKTEIFTNINKVLR